MSENLMKLVEEFRFLEKKKRYRKGALPPKEAKRLRHLKVYLSKKLKLNGVNEASERREELRVPVSSLRVKYRSGKTFVRNYIHNLSPGGVFISTPNPLPLDTRVKLHIVLEEKGVEVEVEGKVVWENTEEGKRKDITRAGMGIKFTRLDDEAKEIIDNLIHGKLKDHARKEDKES